jgi:uncharacterized lipoprotein NlpE involved in copper resistance
MKSRLKLRLSVLAMTLIAAAGWLGTENVRAVAADVPDAAHTSQNALDWAGIYRGTLPCADCEGIDTVVTLRRDGSYLQQSRYLGKSKDVQTMRGDFVWSTDGRNITLKSGSGPVQYQVGEHQLILLDAQGQPVTGDMSKKYVLAQLPASSLEGTKWQLTALKETPIAAGPPSWDITLQASDNSVFGANNCNRIAGGYRLKGANGIRFTPLASTMMACVGGEDTDWQFGQMFDQVKTYRLSGHQLQLFGAKDALLATFEAVYLY